MSRLQTLGHDFLTRLRAAGEAPGFFLALAYLTVLAWLLQRLQAPEPPWVEIRLMGAALAALWIPLWVEALLGLIAARERRASIGSILLCAVLPPLRLGYLQNGQVWLPFIGRESVNDSLRARLESAFAPYMIGFALLILPVLGVEYLWKDVQDHPMVLLGLDIATALIWLAFTVEFIIMVRLASRRLIYIKKHWLELVIILVPFVAFLRGLRLAQAARLTGIARSLRLKGVLTRVMRALFLLNAVQELIVLMQNRNPTKQILKLKRELVVKEGEIKRIQDRIDMLRQIAADKAASED